MALALDLSDGSLVAHTIMWLTSANITAYTMYAPANIVGRVQ